MTTNGQQSPPTGNEVDRIGRAIEHGIEAALTAVSEYRDELSFAVTLAAVYIALWIGLHQNKVTAGVQLAVGVLLVLSVARVRRRLRARLAGAAMRRKWDRACRHVGFPHVRVTRVRSTWSGVRLYLKLRRGTTFSGLDMASESLAAAMGVREISAHRDPDDASRGYVSVPISDPFVEAASKHWPALARTDEWSLWDPIPVGVDEHGATVNIRLVERNLVIAGSPGAGKSCAMSLVLATAALDPKVNLVLIDAKQVELGLWQECAASFAVRIESAVGQLDALQRIMDRRFGELRKAGLRKVTPDWPLYLVAVDELALFTAGAAKKLCDEFSTRLRDIVARGRAAGIICVVATQKPSNDVVPTSLRDLFAYRWCMSVTTPQMSDVALGQGWAGRGYDASEIEPGSPGVGYLLAEEGTPVRLRAHYLDDNDVKALAARAVALRKDHS
jgi:FtsK/SpoIIIE family